MKPWTEEEIETARRLSDDGLRVDVIAARLGRSIGDVRGRFRYDGDEYYWKPEELKRIEQMWRAGASREGIAAEFGVAQTAMQTAMWKAGLLGKASSPDGTANAESAWTSEDEQALVAMFSQGLPLSEIGSRLGRTERAVTHRVRRLKLSRSRPRLRRVTKRPWCAEEEADLRRLYLEWTRLEDIAALLGRTPTAVLAKAYALGVKFWWAAR